MQARFSGGKRISLFSLLLYCNKPVAMEKGSARSLPFRATPLPSRKFKDDQAPDKEKNVRVPAFYRGNAVWGHGLRRRLRYSPDSGPLLRSGKRNPLPLFWEKEGKGRWRSWWPCRAEAYFLRPPFSENIEETVRPQSSQNSKGIYKGGFPAFAAPFAQGTKRIRRFFHA